MQQTLHYEGQNTRSQQDSTNLAIVLEQCAATLLQGVFGISHKSVRINLVALTAPAGGETKVARQLQDLDTPIYPNL